MSIEKLSYTLKSPAVKFKGFKRIDELNFKHAHFASLRDKYHFANDKLTLLRAQQKRLNNTIVSSKRNIEELTETLEKYNKIKPAVGLDSKAMKIRSQIEKQSIYIERNSFKLFKNDKEITKLISSTSKFKSQMLAMQDIKHVPFVPEMPDYQFHKVQQEKKSPAINIASMVPRMLTMSRLAINPALAALTASSVVVMAVIEKNKQEMYEKVKQANSYGMSFESYNAADSFAKGAGLDGSNIADLLEEFRNKKGEQDKHQELFRLANIDMNLLDRLKADEQLFYVFEALEKIQDIDQRVSIADQLLGAEANKIFTYLSKTGLSFNENIEHQKKLLNTTNEMAAMLEEQMKAEQSLSTAMSEALCVISIAFMDGLGVDFKTAGLMVADSIRGASSSVKHLSSQFSNVIAELRSFNFFVPDFPQVPDMPQQRSTSFSELPDMQPPDIGFPDLSQTQTQPPDISLHELSEFPPIKLNEPVIKPAVKPLAHKINNINIDVKNASHLDQEELVNALSSTFKTNGDPSITS